MESPAEFTQLLRRWREGDREVIDQALPVVYDELRRLARAKLHGERDGHTLNPTGLVHEAWLRLVDVQQVEWRDRAHFLAMASRTMRRVLIDHANERNAAKRGGGGERVELADDLAGPEVDLDSLLELNAALERLEAVSPRQAKAVELRFFAGLTLTEAAEVLGTSAPTVMRDLRFAQAWLARELGRAPGGAPANDR
jgi:RNA polymerase sigma factor (TIGR02999 family)